MKKINLGQKEVIHFVGIGGIGMSGLAQIMKNMGFKIQGSDQNKNKNTQSCLKAGIKVFLGHSIANVKSSTILVRSSAIKNSNCEISYARKKKNTYLFKSRSFGRCSLFKKKYYNYWISWKNDHNITYFKNSI